MQILFRKFCSSQDTAEKPESAVQSACGRENIFTRFMGIRHTADRENGERSGDDA
jgi:hypothetical protein